MVQISRDLADESDRQMNALRSWTFVLFLYGSMVAIGLIFLPSLLLPRQIAMIGVRTWARLARWGMRVICGAETEFRNQDSLTKEPVLVACKHQSTIDTLMPFLYLKDPCIVLKKELLWYPFFGWYALKIGMIPIDRSGSMKALKTMTKQAKAVVDEGRSLLIFPEGTRYSPGEKAEYKTGIALLYKELGVDCLPVALNTGICWPPKGVPRYPGKMVIEFQPLIETGLNRKAFMTAMETRIESAADRLLLEGRAARAKATGESA